MRPRDLNRLKLFSPTKQGVIPKSVINISSTGSSGSSGSSGGGG